MTAREPAFNPDFVRDISEKVYRAGSYDALTRVYLKALEINR